MFQQAFVIYKFVKSDCFDCKWELAILRQLDTCRPRVEIPLVQINSAYLKDRKTAR